MSDQLPHAAQPRLVLEVEHLHKKFCRNLRKSMIYGTKDLVRGLFGLTPASGHLRAAEFWALNNVSFQLRENEILGIVGANGSGKSTLLRVLTGIYPPDRGRVWMDGRVGGIIALGAGMHPHMTGRENIFLNATILGMGRDEISEKFDSIVDFADLGEFLDAPLSSYSSGMKVRLGFAVAIHCRPDILLIDEVLAVGDQRFRNKCLAALADYRKSAKAVIFISHDLDQIRSLCTRALVMEHGNLVFDGPVPEALLAYDRILNTSRHSGDVVPLADFSDAIRDMKIDAEQYETTGMEAGIRFNFSFVSAENAPVHGIVILTKAGDRYPLVYEEIPFDLNAGAHSIRGEVRAPLKSGVYDVYFHIRNTTTNEVYSQFKFPSGLTVHTNAGHTFGLIHAQSEWKINHETTL